MHKGSICHFAVTDIPFRRGGRAQMEAHLLGSGCGGLYHTIGDALEAAEDGDIIRIYRE